MSAVGDNAYGQFGNGSTIGSCDMKEIPSIAFKQIAAGAWHLLALDTVGRVFGWGKCNEGQLGFRPSKGVKMQTSPVLIPF